jgi:hypothetical protein
MNHRWLAAPYREDEAALEVLLLKAQRELELHRTGFNPFDQALSSLKEQ